jgi:DnaJ-class molecular chaperone
MDPYKLLHVSRSASKEEIKASYRKLSRTCHPDTNPDRPTAQKEFCELTQARDILLDDAKRQMFDRGGLSAVSQFDTMRQQQEAMNRKLPPTLKTLCVSLTQVYKGETIMYSGIPLCLKTLPLGQTINIPNMGDSLPDYIPGDLHLTLALSQDQPPYRLSINNGNIILETDLNFGALLKGFTIVFDHPEGGKLVIREKWQTTEAIWMRVYPRLGINGNRDLIVKAKLKLDNLSDIPADIIQALETRCPHLFTTPIIPEKYKDISKLGGTARNTNGPTIGTIGNNCIQQ